jgi:hypothetical protein
MSESEKEFDYNSVHNLEGTLPDTRLESTASIIKDISKLPLNIQDYYTTSDSIARIYMGQMTYYSITLDLIALYLKGQKLLYVESKTFCEQLLYLLMLPAIFISAVCTILSVGLQNYKYGPIIVSSFTGFNSFILGVITYLKLDAKSEAHKTTAYQFDKLQTQCEFFSGKTLMLQDAKVTEKVKEFVESLEKKVAEIKDVNQFIIPEAVRYRYSKIYAYNVFADMKKYKTIRLLATQTLININKEIEKRINTEDKCCQNESIPLTPQGSVEIKPDEVVIDISKLTRSESKGNLVMKSIKNIMNLNKNKENILEQPLDIYSKCTSIERLLKERDRLINQIMEYRNISITLNEDFDQQINENIKDKSGFCCNILRCLKN